MARLRPRSGASVGTLTLDETWFLTFGHLGSICGSPNNPFVTMERARRAWLQHRTALLATKFPGQQLFAEELFDGLPLRMTKNLILPDSDKIKTRSNDSTSTETAK